MNTCPRNRFQRSRSNTRASLACACCLLFIFTLGACGGGGASTNDSSGSASYVTWANSANGVTIKDAVNNSFAVDLSTREVVALSTGGALLGLTVPVGRTTLSFNGLHIGDVLGVPSTAGTQISELVCSGPAPQYGAMTITAAAGKWDYTCASATLAGNSSKGSATGASAYGSLAVNATTLAAGISVDYSSQTASDQQAISTCGGGACGVVINLVGTGTCGALSESANGAWGASSGVSLSNAIGNALSTCQAKGGTSCTTLMSGCN